MLTRLPPSLATLPPRTPPSRCRPPPPPPCLAHRRLLLHPSHTMPRHNPPSSSFAIARMSIAIAPHQNDAPPVSTLASRSVHAPPHSLAIAPPPSLPIVPPYSNQPRPAAFFVAIVPTPSHYPHIRDGPLLLLPYRATALTHSSCTQYPSHGPIVDCAT
ncbi:hypothetical protein BDW22DRAFT_1432477 [Trametopsis cervina]|nr:hypothetical protein BDW22DRAFT_1432477 [Trametopsis cervina]